MAVTPQRRPRRPRGSLNQQVITEAALRIADRDGMRALTFEALGRELGAHATAIYRYFRDKDDLLLALIDHLHGLTASGGLPVTDDWAADLKTVADRIHSSFLAHPQIGRLIAARTARRVHEFELVEYILGCMRRAGLDDKEAARCYRVFADAVLSYSAMDAALQVLEPSRRDADLLSWQVEYRDLSDEEYPNLGATVGLIPPLDSGENFSLLVELLITAIGARVRGQRAEA